MDGFQAKIIEFIDYAEETYGDRITFLTFKEAAQRMETHLLDGLPIRAPQGAAWYTMWDANQDGFWMFFWEMPWNPKLKFGDPISPTFKPFQLPWGRFARTAIRREFEWGGFGRMDP